MRFEYMRPCYEAFTDAIWDVDPDIQVVASGRMITQPDYTGHPCYGGGGVPKLRCDVADEHYYQSAVEQAWCMFIRSRATCHFKRPGFASFCCLLSLLTTHQTNPHTFKKLTRPS